ncbi:MAG: PLP-dependent transferase [Candidatus Edwardsbacteria bacterium]|nr:PLP-dependent transferase [Candidatus Edwardsbacteria bacterium]
MSDAVQKYVAKANKMLAERERYIKEEVRKWRFDTIAVHGTYSVQEAIENNQGAIIEPMFLSSAQAYRDCDEMEAAQTYQIPTWAYTRIHNPSQGYLEDTLALLDGYGSGADTSCFVTASGMAAIAAAIHPLLAHKADESANFVACTQVYGGTFQLFNVRKMQEQGIECRWVADPNNLDEWKSKIDKNTRFLYGELPSNPGLSFFDLKKVTGLAHEHGLPFIADSTVATPALLRPIEHGADIVVHSVTKTMTSGGLTIAGAVIARKNIVCNIPNDALKADFAKYCLLWPNRDSGGSLSPLHAILALNEIRTLRTRVDALSQSSMKVATFLEKHPKVAKVNYLGLDSHKLHGLAQKYLWLVDAKYDAQYGKDVNRYGHLLSFIPKGGVPAARLALDGLKRIWRATDLGRIKSIATIPSISTHQQMGEESRSLAAIPGDLIRLSVGAEHPDDIINDLDQALAKVK